MINLMPCPFCGSKAKLYVDGGGVCVKCTNCFAQTESKIDSCYADWKKRNVLERVIKAWNSRYSRGAIDKWINAKDALPERKQWVLMFNLYSNGRTSTIMHGWYDAEHQKWQVNGYVESDAEVYWIPIPEKPDFTAEVE